MALHFLCALSTAGGAVPVLATLRFDPIVVSTIGLDQMPVLRHRIGRAVTNVVSDVLRDPISAFHAIVIPAFLHAAHTTVP
jgi:hypothetical protein